VTAKRRARVNHSDVSRKWVPGSDSWTSERSGVSDAANSSVSQS